MVALALFSLNGCSLFTKKIEVSAKPVEKPTLELPQADALSLRQIRWTIITADNFDAEVAKLKSSGNAVAFFALTADGYKNLGLNMRDVMAYIEQQQVIIGTYEEYYKDSDASLDKTNDESTKTLDTIDEAQK